MMIEQISSSFHKDKTRFKFQPAATNQRALIHEWLAQPHIKEWLHGPGLKNTLEDLDKFLSGSSLFQHWVAYDNKTPFAYLLTSNVEKEAPTDNDAITLDLFICRVDYIGKGLAVQMIHELLLSHFSHVSEVHIDPEKSNTRAIHVYQKAGFHITSEFIAPWHPVLHYQMKLNMEELIRAST